MKYSLVLAALLLLPAASVSAAPFAAPANPNVVALYFDGDHGIVGQQFRHVGTDIVIKTSRSGNFLQWFWGSSEQEGFHGEFSFWKPSAGGRCPYGWHRVPQANPAWGDYLNENTDYCVFGETLNLEDRQKNN